MSQKKGVWCVSGGQKVVFRGEIQLCGMKKFTKIFTFVGVNK